jgi:hypothetical protein
MNFYELNMSGREFSHKEVRPFHSAEDAQKFCNKEAQSYGVLAGQVVRLQECFLAKIEVTDLYCGEANYNWVHRHEVYLPINTMQREIIRRAKALEGWTGMRTNNEYYEDMVVLRPRGLLQVMFITFEY